MYVAYLHSSLKHGILFWGSTRNLKKVLNCKKRAIRLIANITSTTSCKPCFKKLEIIIVPCIINYINAQRLGWFGHLHQMSEEGMVKKVYKWKPILTRPLGRPKTYGKMT